MLAEPSTAPDPLLDPLTAPLGDNPAAASETKTQTTTTWPCLSCGELMPLEDSLCGHCGASFLPSAGMPTLTLPGLGVLNNLEGGAKAMVIIGGALVITILFFVAAFVLGSIF